MSIWDDLEEWEKDDEDDANPYLVDVKKSIELIAKLLKYENNQENKLKRRNISRLDKLMDRKLLISLKNVELIDELKVYSKILTLSDKLNEQNRLVLLKNKVVIGVGGKFSAGKSCFINSIIGTQILPENQDETTSIATYIVNGDRSVNYAYTYNNQKIELDFYAVNAICHEFKNRYGIGFAGYISNIVIQIENFMYPDIALLDTPGYSKDDSGILKEISDENVAREQLRTIDYLIWLVDVENGVIQQKDIEFIQDLNIETPILIIINKSSKKPESFVKRVVESAKQSLDNARISYFDVIAYDSIVAKEYLNNDGLKRFMDMANSSGKKSDDVRTEMNNQVDWILKQLKKRKSDYMVQVQKIGDVIFRTTDNMEIQGLVEIYADLKNEIRNLSECIKNVNKTANQINMYMKRLGL